MSDPTAADGIVSASDNQGRVLSGVGEISDQLAERMEQRAPAEPVEKPAAPAAEPATPAAGEPPVTRGRQRFSDLTRERDEARASEAASKAEREAIARERDELKARLDKPAEPARQEPAAVPAKPAAATSNERFPSFEQWAALDGNGEKTFEDFIDARSDWRYAENRKREQAEYAGQAEQRDYQEKLAKYSTDLADVVKELPDFESAMAAFTASKRGVSLVIERASLEVGPRAAYWLATHPDDCEALTLDTLVDSAGQPMTPQHPAFKTAVASTRRYLAALVAQSQTPAAPAKAVKPAWTPPPAPHPTVGASSPTSATPSSDLAKKGHDFDASGYREKRAAERKVNKRW